MSAARVLHATVTDQPISSREMADLAWDETCGAVVTFDGIVRNHDDGKGVEGLEYEAHPSAAAEIAAVAADIAQRHPEVRLAVAHRYGTLGIGDTALAAAVASAHRKAAFAACDELVDEVKRRVPIWKHQRFTDGTEEWVDALG